MGIGNVPASVEIYIVLLNSHINILLSYVLCSTTKFTHRRNENIATISKALFAKWSSYSRNKLKHIVTKQRVSEAEWNTTKNAASSVAIQKLKSSCPWRVVLREG
jgi:hypothetical protein